MLRSTYKVWNKDRLREFGRNFARCVDCVVQKWTGILGDKSIFMHLKLTKVVLLAITKRIYPLQNSRNLHQTCNISVKGIWFPSKTLNNMQMTVKIVGSSLLEELCLTWKNYLQGQWIVFIYVKQHNIWRGGGGSYFTEYLFFAESRRFTSEKTKWCLCRRFHFPWNLFLPLMC